MCFSELYSQHCHSQALCLTVTTVYVNLYHKTDSIGRVTGSWVSTLKGAAALWTGNSDGIPVQEQDAGWSSTK